MTRSFWILLVSLTHLAVAPYVFARSTGLKLEVATKLGVKTTVDVKAVKVGDPLLDELSGTYTISIYPDKAKLVVQKSDNTFILIPWKDVTEATTRERKHVVKTRNGSEYIGKVKATITSADDPEKEYDLSTATSLKVLETPPERKEARSTAGKKRSEWTLSMAGPESSPISLFDPFFVFSYYSSSGYFLGGTDHEIISRTFFLTVEGERTQANIDDFVLLDFRAVSGKSTLGVKAKDGDLISGALTFSAKDDKGDHKANSWLLAAELPDGCIFALKEPAGKLERK